MHTLLIPLALALSLSVGCDSAPEADVEPRADDDAVETDEGDDRDDGTDATRDGVGPVPEAWVAERVADSRRRLTSSEAGQRVWQAIEAHGGLERWLSSGTIAFEFDYAPLGSPERRMHTHNQVDIWGSRARQQEVGEPSNQGPAEESDGEPGAARATFGWDGERAWITPSPEAFPSPARFWATTPYYFVGMPFVLGDPGTRFERLEDAELEGELHHLVKVTYEEGTGDSPDDYYILYIHPETHRVGGLRYVVAYPGFFPEGGHTPEKLMIYDEQRQVEGLWLSHDMDAYAWDAEARERREKVTEITVADVELGQAWPGSLFAPPVGAEVITEIQARQ